MTDEDRLALAVMIHANSRLLPSGCWEWTGGVNNSGYGQKSWQHRMHTAHRLSHMAFTGPIPEGYEIDHTCHDPDKCHLGIQCPHRRCVNPAHLEAVEPKVNDFRRRLTHCKRGHPFSGDNLYVVVTRGGGKGRRCRACRALWYEAGKAKAAA